MAVDYSEYARIYGGGSQAQQGAAQFGAGIGRGLSAIPNIEDRIRVKETEAINDSFSPLQSLYTSSVADWTDLSSDVLSSGGAFMALKGSSISPGILSNRQKKVAKRKGLLNPVKFIEQYDAQKNVIVPILTKKLKAYQTTNNLSNTQMRKFFDNKPKLRDFFLTNIPEEQLADYGYLVPKETAFKQLSKLGEDFGTPDEWSLGEMAWKGPLSVAAPGGIPFQTGKISKKLMNFATEKFGMKEGKAKELIGEGVELASTYGAGKGLKKMGSAITKAISKKGTGTIIKKVINKLGMKKAAGMLAKIGIGSIGGVLTGGALTVAMGAMALKDVYDIYNIIVEE
jgi:hypothetical protein